MKNKKYLYKMNEFTDNVEIYKLIPKLNDISSFREKTMESNNNLYNALLNTSVNKVDISSKYMISNDKLKRNLSEDEVNNEYHRLVKSNSNKKDIIDNYINYGIDDNSSLYHVVGKKNYGIIVPNENYEFHTKNMAIIRDIIKVPDELYVLEKLIQGEYDKIKDYYLEVLSPLFNVMQIGAISYRDIKNVYDLGLVNDDLNDVVSRIDITEKVLQKIKK